MICDLKEFKQVSNLLYDALIALDNVEDTMSKIEVTPLLTLADLLEANAKKDAIIKTFDFLTGRGQFLYDVTRIRTDNKMGHWAV